MNKRVWLILAGQSRQPLSAGPLISRSPGVGNSFPLKSVNQPPQAPALFTLFHPRHNNFSGKAENAIIHDCSPYFWQPAALVLWKQFRRFQRAYSGLLSDVVSGPTSRVFLAIHLIFTRAGKPIAFLPLIHLAVCLPFFLSPASPSLLRFLLGLKSETSLQNFPALSSTFLIPSSSLQLLARLFFQLLPPVSIALSLSPSCSLEVPARSHEDLSFHWNSSAADTLQAFSRIYSGCRARCRPENCLPSDESTQSSVSVQIKASSSSMAGVRS